MTVQPISTVLLIERITAFGFLDFRLFRVNIDFEV